MSGVQFTLAAPTCASGLIGNGRPWRFKPVALGGSSPPSRTKRASGLIGNWQTLRFQTPCSWGFESPLAHQSSATRRGTAFGQTRVSLCAAARPSSLARSLRRDCKSERNSQARSSEAERPFYTGRVGISKFPAPTIRREPDGCSQERLTRATTRGRRASAAHHSSVPGRRMVRKRTRRCSTPTR